MTAAGRFQIPDKAWASQKLAPLLAWSDRLRKVWKGKAASSGSRLVPALRYRDVDQAIDWLCAAFGFVQRDVVVGADGGILYAHLTHGSDMILVRSIGDSVLDQLMKQPDEIGGAETQSCYLVVEDEIATTVRPVRPALTSCSMLPTTITAGAATRAATPRGTRGASAHMILGKASLFRSPPVLRLQRRVLPWHCPPCWFAWWAGPQLDGCSRTAAATRRC
ncbi:MAG TPA: hypothetical protein VFR73_09300 [Hyphomicrobiaceae bacterium]|nr:hypothetical protein [Hyphomicrobiaceae bacterium]